MTNIYVYNHIYTCIYIYIYMCNHYCSFNESPNSWIIFGNYIQFLDESLGFAPKVSHLHILYIYINGYSLIGYNPY